YTDCEGNSHPWVYTYTVEYQDFTMPANSGSTVACFADITLPTPPSVNDNCGNAITPTGPVTGGTYTSCEGTYAYTWTYTDCEGNSHPWVYTYTIERNDFSVPANGSSTVACIALATAPVPPSVNDNCGNAITPTGPVTGGTYTSCEGTRTYTYTYTDCEGNSHPWVYTYTIEREDFTMPANGGSTVSCIASATAPTPPTVTDACGNAITPVGPTMGGNYTSCEGTRTFTWVYTDCEGNSHPWVYTYTIELGELTVPAWGSSTVSCITQFTQPTPPVVTDACGNVLTPTGPNLGINYNSCEGSYTYSWTYTDCKGNTNDWAYTYYIDNNTPPNVTSTNSSFNPDIENYTCGVSYTFPAGQSSCIINKSLSVPTWADDCGSVVSDDYVTSNGIVLSRIGDIVIGNFPVGQTIVTFRAFDCANNTGTCTVKITVNDQQNPTLTGCPTNKLGNADSGTCTKTFNLVIPTASDNCAVASVNYTVTGSTALTGTEFPNELTFNVGLSTVTYTVYDPAGNSATCSFSVYVNDAQPLTIACPANTTVSTDAGVCTHTGIAGVFNVTVNDNCPPASQVYTLTGATASTGSNTLDGVALNKGVTNIRWVVTDQGGVAKSCSFNVTVNDTEMPSVPADAASTVSCPSAMVAPTVPSGTDNCGGAVAGVLVSVVNNPSSLTCEGTRT
ncbi:MAG: HYR domain-containing protein, partial [Bacteroidota bacterium]